MADWVMESDLFQRLFTMSRLQKKSQWGQITHVFSMIMALLSAGERGIMGDWVTDIRQTEPILRMFTTSATHPRSLPEMISLGEIYKWYLGLPEVVSLSSYNTLKGRLGNPVHKIGKKLRVSELSLELIRQFSAYNHPAEKALSSK